MKYRRVFVPGGTYFFTLVTFNRLPIFTTPQAVETLRSAFRYVMERHPFTIIASAILLEHTHFIWTLPPGDSDFPTRWRLIKGEFTRHWNVKETSESASRLLKGEQDVWQRRFWEHLIRDEADLSRHVEYIHYNPVKHGLAKSAWDWEYSSFRKYVKEGLYSQGWGGDGKVWAGEALME